MTDPWLPPPAQPYAPPTAQPVAPPQPYAPPSYPAQPYPAPPVHGPAVRQGPSRTAITALVLASLALLGVVGLTLAPLLFVGTMMGFDDAAFDEMAMGSEEYELLGTLPLAEPTADYPDELLVAEIERVLENDWSTFDDIVCEPLGRPVEGATTTCTGDVDRMATDIGIEVEDDLGHFTLTESW